MIRIVTDTASDMKESETRQMNIELVSLSVTFEGIDYQLENDEHYDEFYRLLEMAKHLPKTSQPTPAQYLDIFLDAKEKGDDVLVITISSELSGTFNSAQNAKEMSEYDKIRMIDSRQATISQRMLVNYAVRMRDSGKTIDEIEELVLSVRDRMFVCGMADTLTYLQKGGRIPPALALIGNTLRIKPILILKDRKLEPLGKSRGLQKGIQRLYEELQSKALDENFPVYFGYARERSLGEKFMHDAVEQYHLPNTALFPIGNVIGTHIGPGSLAVAFVRK